ncbi:mechanosensitive ion channel [Alcaligenes ammonioxydans]|uniref:mechanosensitive ion channel family protein n=1 Tax=Alcaligenes ammonioxydans TaxID=2582914 RepID=UPI001F069D18|nr:mechanosensitive ion channel domain-containing protein [Alcaligenes ammonioxydans]MCH1880451.1 mechanosensitive ion channel [Alcaligenes ammonioxydans]
MKPLRRCAQVLLVLLSLMVGWVPMVQAQALSESEQERQMMRELQQAQDELRLMQYGLEGNQASIRPERSYEQDQKLQRTQDLSSRVVQSLERRSRLLQARLQELGEDAGDEADQLTLHNERMRLRRADAALRADLRVARLVQLESQQTRQLLHEATARYAKEKRWQRSPSLVLLESLPELRAAWPEDRQKLSDLAGQWRQTWKNSSWQQSSASLWLVAAVLMLGMVLFRMTPIWISRYLPAGRLRRSSLTIVNFFLWFILSWVLVDQLVELVMERPGLSTIQYELLAYLNLAAWLAAVVLASIKGIVIQPRSSWRLIPVSAQTQGRLRYFAYAFFLVAYLDVAESFFRGSIGVSDAFQALLDGVSSVLYLLLYAYGLWVMRDELFDRTEIQGQSAVRTGRSWARLAFKGAVVVYVLVLGLFIGGWQVLSDDLMTHFMTMPLVLGLLAYVFMVCLQDMSDSLLAYLRNRSRDPEAAPIRVQSQLVVVFFALARMTVLGLAIWMGSGDWLNEPKQMLESGLGVSRDVLRLGAVQWRLDLWLIALGVLLVGAVLIHCLRVWLRQRYMPNTTLEPGLQNAIVGVVGYIAYFVLLVICLSMLGVPIESVTWVFTALTVGLGFGLRGIVQNIASGLMLMVERPVKVGDWVEVQGSEGNVRQIRLRATYVERFDRTMVMVPNSQMMGQQVRNLTYTPSSLGAIESRLLFPLDVDADAIMQILREAVMSEPEILDEPAPVLSCDGIFGDGLAFSMRCFINSMRVQRRVRSNLMLEILRRLRQQGITLHPAQRWVQQAMDKDRAQEPDF